MRKYFLLMFMSLILIGCAVSQSQIVYNKNSLSKTIISYPYEYRSNHDEIEIDHEKQRKFMLQIEQFKQETSYYCGPANIQMILHYFHIDKGQDILAKQLHTHPITGTEYVDMANVLNQYLFGKNPENDYDSGYRVQTLQNHDYDPIIKSNFETRIKQNVASGYPTVVATNMQILYPDLPAANHVLLCIGYVLSDTSDTISYYYLIDPYEKVWDVEFKGLKIFSAEQLMKAIVENDEPAYIW